MNLLEQIPLLLSIYLVGPSEALESTAKLCNSFVVQIVLSSPIQTSVLEPPDKGSLLEHSLSYIAGYRAVDCRLPVESREEGAVSALVSLLPPMKL